MKISDETIFRAGFWLVIAAICLAALCSCWQSSRDEQTEQVKNCTERYTGQIVVPIPVPGQPATDTTPAVPATVHPVPIEVNLTRTVDEQTSTVGHADSKAGVDAAAIAQQVTSSVLAAAKTAFPAAAPFMASMSPAPAKPGTDWASIAGLATTLVGGAGAVHLANRKRLQRAEQDAEEGWEEAKRHQQRAFDLALQLPPTNSTPGKS